MAYKTSFYRDAIPLISKGTDINNNKSTRQVPRRGGWTWLFISSFPRLISKIDIPGVVQIFVKRYQAGSHNISKGDLDFSAGVFKLWEYEGMR
jgi:hypothetical protein